MAAGSFAASRISSLTHGQSTGLLALLRGKVMLARLCLAMFMAAPSILLAQETLLPVVANVTENAAGTQIIINGAGFGKTTPAVSLGGVNLTVVNSTDYGRNSESAWRHGR